MALITLLKANHAIRFDGDVGLAVQNEMKMEKQKPLKNTQAQTKTNAVTTTCKTKYINYLWFFV